MKVAIAAIEGATWITCVALILAFVFQPIERKQVVNSSFKEVMNIDKQLEAQSKALSPKNPSKPRKRLR